MTSACANRSRSMPVYEYRCDKCRRKTSVLVRSSQSAIAPTCGHCGSRTLRRLFSTFAVRRGGASDAGEGFGGGGDDMGLEGVDQSDPRSMAKWMRKMGEESGEEM